MGGRFEIVQENEVHTFVRLALNRFLLLAFPLAGSAEPGVAVSGKNLLNAAPAADDQTPILLASIKITDWEALARSESCRAPRACWRGPGEPPTE